MIYNTELYHSVDSALSKLLQYIEPCLEPEFVPVFDSRGYILKEDVISNDDIPRYPISNMFVFDLKSV